MSSIKLAGIIRESIVDGPGIRFVVFAQGCPHHCKGCHNPQTWPYEGGKDTETDSIITEIKKNPLLKGITLSGGEPFSQAEALAELAKKVHEQSLNVITYTGYFFEQLLEMSEQDTAIKSLLEQTDILIDGPFIDDQMSYELRFRGSTNQRIIDVKKTLTQGEVVLADI